MKTLIPLLLTTFVSISTLAQEPIISPAPGNYTSCPGELIVYEIQPGRFSGCGDYTWTVTNGSFSSTATITSKTTTTNEVDVYWKDFAGNGTLTVSSTCSGETLSVSKTYAIRSLAGRVPQNIRKNPNLNFCETLSVRVFIDVMFLENTGGSTNIQPQQRADGYEWTMPAGWTHNGSATTPVRTIEEFIDITPTDGCKGGSITVKAFKNCVSGRKYSASSASLSLNRPIGTNLRVPAGYTGPKCGDTNPVLFTATNIQCATNYRWTATGTQWKDAQGALGPWNTATNSITLFPTGTINDQGNIAADIVLPCATLTQTFNALYTNPNLPSPSYTTNSPQLLCTNGSGTVGVNAITEAASYTWYTTGGAVFVNGVQTSQSNPITTAITNVSVSAPTLNNGTGYKIFLHVNANRATIGCAGSNVVVREIWLGKPANVNTIAQGLQTPPPYYVCPNTTYQFNAFDFTNITNITTYSWYTYGNHTITSYNGTGNITANIRTGNNVANTYISVRSQNTCGNAINWTDAILQLNGACGCGGFECMFSISPNPSSDYVEVAYEGEESPDFEIGMYNENGKMIYSNRIKQKKNKIDVRGIKPGIYILKIASKKESTEKRIKID
jgi:hypothetical protein